MEANKEMDKLLSVKEIEKRLKKLIDKYPLEMLGQCYEYNKLTAILDYAKEIEKLKEGFNAIKQHIELSINEPRLSTTWNIANKYLTPPTEENKTVDKTDNICNNKEIREQADI